MTADTETNMNTDDFLVESSAIRVQAATTVGEALERLAAVLDAAEMGTFRWEMESDALDWDTNLDRLFGLASGTTVRTLENFLSCVHPADRVAVLAQCDQCRNEGRDFEAEYRVVWPAGSLHWLYVKGKTFFERGKPVTMTGACVDITRRKVSEAALQERTRLAELGVEIGIVLTSINPLPVILRRCSEALVKHLGSAFARIWTLNEATQTLELQASAGQYTHLDGPHSSIPIGRFKIGEIARDRKPHLTNAVVGDPRVGDQEWARREGMIAFAGYPLVAEDRLLGVVAMFARHSLSENILDALGSIANQIALVIESKRAEEHIQTLNARLQRAMIETHHRVKNNLQLMSALIDMQRGSYEDLVPISEFVRLSANVRALGVIHDILTQEAKEGNEQETLSAKAVLDSLLTMLRGTAGENRLTFEIEEIRLIGRQATSLALITNEMVSNAQKHGRSETYVTLTARGKTGRLEVLDDGPGFPPEFDAISASNTGLELVESMAEWDMRGQTKYESRPEGGGHVTLDFSIAEA